jgi:hypothetical protein
MIDWEESTEPKRRLRLPRPDQPDRTWDTWHESTQNTPRERAHWGRTAPYDPDEFEAGFKNRRDRLLCISCNVPACTGCGFGRGAKRKQRKPAARGSQIDFDL